MATTEAASPRKNVVSRAKGAGEIVVAFSVFQRLCVKSIIKERLFEKEEKWITQRGSEAP